MCFWSVVTDSDGQKREVGPIKCVEEFPPFDMGVDCCSREEVDQKADSLEHEGALAHGELEFFVIVSLVSTPYGHYHEASYKEIKCGSEDGVVERLSEGVGLSWVDNEGPSSAGGETNKCY